VNTSCLTTGLAAVPELDVPPHPGPALAARTAFSAARSFAVGDVRHDSVKRVASAAGDGAVVVSQVHEHLARAAVTV